MTDADHELLEKAAKAADLTYEKSKNKLPGLVIANNGDWRYGCTLWNPLIDDGDALRLAVKLQLFLGVENTAVNVWKPGGFRGDGWSADAFKGDPCATTRRAIVRAAAMLAAPPQPAQQGDKT